MRKTIGIAVAIVAVLAISYFFMPAIAWDGGVVRRVHVQVAERGSNSPIVGAIVVIKWRDYNSDHDASADGEPFGKVMSSGNTDSQGRCTLTHLFGAGGSSFLFWRTGDFALSNNLRVEADGYRSFESPLATVLGETKRSIMNKRPIEIRVGVSREATHNHALNDDRELPAAKGVRQPPAR